MPLDILIIKVYNLIATGSLGIAVEVSTKSGNHHGKSQ
jgi:hypothetical protein